MRYPNTGKNVPHECSYLRLTHYSGEASRKHLSLFKMHSSLMIFIFYLLLSQLIIPLYGVPLANDLIRSCISSGNWITPSWPANILQYCQGVMTAFEYVKPEVHSISAPAHEFLPMGMAQTPYEGKILKPVRTPWKISSGALFLHSRDCSIFIMGLDFPTFRSNVGSCSGPCTLAITPVNKSDSVYFPVGIPAAPYPTSGVFTWRALYYAAVSIRDLCLDISKYPEAGIVWLDSSDTLPLYKDMFQH